MALILGACGGGASLTEYAEDVEALVGTMNARLDRLDADLEGNVDLGRAQRYADERVGARSDFIEGFQALDPPGQAVDLHQTALEIMGRLLDAEAALADRVQTMESAVGLDEIWETPEGVAARSADEDAVALCLAAQADFDETQERARLRGVPWVPKEMKEVIRIALGCDAESR